VDRLILESLVVDLMMPDLDEIEPVFQLGDVVNG
jgi:hypothetical protein